MKILLTGSAGSRAKTFTALIKDGNEAILGTVLHLEQNSSLYIR